MTLPNQTKWKEVIMFRHRSAISNESLVSTSLTGRFLWKVLQGYVIIIEQFWGDDVLDSYIIAYRDEDSISDQIYEKQIFSAFYSNDLKF